MEDLCCNELSRGYGAIACTPSSPGGSGIPRQKRNQVPGWEERRFDVSFSLLLPDRVLKCEIGGARQGKQTERQHSAEKKRCGKKSGLTAGGPHILPPLLPFVSSQVLRLDDTLALGVLQLSPTFFFFWCHE